MKIAATTTDHGISIRVRDNGRGIRKDEKVKAKWFGIMGMRERAQTFGGIIKVSGRPGKGTMISIQFPVQ